MKINRVTITGADDNTKIKELVKTTKDYPFVEWGILFSGKNLEKGTKGQRYPSNMWVDKLLENDLPLSAHFCGWWSKEILVNKNYSLISELPKQFKRVQLNYNFKRSNGWDLGSLFEFAEKTDMEIILQYNKSNADTLDPLIDVPKNVHFLYDASGGRGTVISSIEEPIHDSYTGYAGGLTPSNTGSICEMIVKDEDESTVWIDLESGARTDNEFDIQKVKWILETSSQFVQ